MRSRWFHVPRFHFHGSGVEKRATWLELFYDLIFVAAFIQLGDALSHHVTFEGFAQFAGLFACMWIAWTGFTQYVNRFTVDDITHRLLVFAQMFAIGGMAVSVEHVLKGDPHYFAGAYAIVQALVAVMYHRGRKGEVPEACAYARYWRGVFATGAVVWAVSLLVPSPWSYALWPVGALVILRAPLSKRSRALAERSPIDHEHISERFSLLTLIVLGESFVKVLSTLQGHAEGEALLQMSMTLLITCSIWWVYFDDVAGSTLRHGKVEPTIWLYAHLPLQIAVTGVGVAVKKAVHFDLSQPAPEAYRYLLAGTLGLAMLSVAVIDSVTERRQAELSDRVRVNVRTASAFLLFVLAPAGASMHASMFMVLLITVCVAQIIFDIMMAPFEAESEHIEKPVTTAELARRRLAGERTLQTAAIRRDVGEAVRRGAPSELRRDFYFYIMEGSWKRFFVVLAFLYVITNVFFAGLYTIRPGCIDGANPDSFADAFYFSVQTLSTIGYGAMSPETDYGHIIVTIEAAIGLLGVALATGLMFAKASRPRSSTLFSDVMILTRRHGVNHLVMRAGNARGNDVVDATVSLTVLLDEFTPEGEHMRRLHTLKLLRDRTPLFALSWTIMHEIDDDSPLAGIDWNDPDNLIAIIATLVGHDGTYGQTVYARRTYYPDQIRAGHRFVDVISRMSDGRMQIDYGRFHDTEPEDESRDTSADDARDDAEPADS